MEHKPFELTNGAIILTTNASAGIYNSVQLKLIASLCDKEIALVKATEDQRLAVCVSKEHVEVVTTQLESVGLGVSQYRAGIIQPSACLGELCPKHEQDALGSAIDVGDQLSGLSVPALIKIGINGCAECCVPCHSNEISIVGESEGYRISVGGKGSQMPELSTFVAEAVPASELAKRVKDIVVTYTENAQLDETFHEYIERSGVQKIIEVLSPYSSEASVNSEELPKFSKVEEVPSEMSHDDDSIPLFNSSEIEIRQIDTTEQKFDINPTGNFEEIESGMAEIEVNPVEKFESDQEINEGLAMKEIDDNWTSIEDATEHAIETDTSTVPEPMLIEDELILMDGDEFEDQFANKSKLSLVEASADKPTQRLAKPDQITRCEITEANQFRLDFQSGAHLEFKSAKSREFDFLGQRIRVQNDGSQIAIYVEDMVFSFPIRKAS